MKNLVIGASGLIGSALILSSNERGHESTGTRLLDKGSNTEILNVTDRPKVQRVIRNLEPDVIYFLASGHNPEKAETDPDKSYNINVLGLKNVLDATIRVNSKLVFVSSAYIFDGTAGPYSESDTASPGCVLGWHKLLGEHLIATSECDHLIIRTSSVFGWDRLSKNPVLQVIQMLKNERQVAMPEDIIETPIYNHCLADAILDLVESKQSGVFNVCGNEAVSLYRFGKNIASVFGLESSLIKPIKAKNLKSKVDRPLNACLTNKKAKKLISTTLPSTNIGLKQMLKDDL